MGEEGDVEDGIEDTDGVTDHAGAPEGGGDGAGDLQLGGEAQHHS